MNVRTTVGSETRGCEVGRDVERIAGIDDAVTRPEPSHGIDFPIGNISDVLVDVIGGRTAHVEPEARVLTDVEGAVLVDIDQDRNDHVPGLDQ